MDIFHAFFSPVNAFYQLWQRVIASTVYIWWVDHAAAVQAGPLIKYSAYANEKILPSRPSRSPLYNEVDRDGSIVLIWKLVYERHHWHSAAALFYFFIECQYFTSPHVRFANRNLKERCKENVLQDFHIRIDLSPPALCDVVGWRACVQRWPQ